MKVIISFGVLFFILTNTVTSQITITSSDMPQPGDTLRLSTTTDTTGLPAPTYTGAGITWDYSKLIAASQTIDTFLSISSTPFLYQLYFTGYATVAQSTAGVSDSIISITNIVDFYKDQTSNYEGVGYGATIEGLPASVKDDSIDVIYNFPMNYGNSDSCYSSNHLSIPTLGYYGQYQYRINYVDGWGTLKTPFGIFSTLKVKTLLYSSDSIYIDDFSYGFKTPQIEQIQYKWLANGQHIPLLQINETVLGGKPIYVNSVYRDSIRKVPTGIAEINSSIQNVSLRPNPAVKNTFLSYSLLSSSPANIAIYSIDGRCIGTIFNGNQSSGKHNFNVDVSGYKSGVYFIKIEANGQQEIKKLVVVK